MNKLRNFLARLRSSWRLWDRRTLGFFINRELLEYLRGPGWLEKDVRHYAEWRQTLERGYSLEWRLAHPFPCYAYGAIDYIERAVCSEAVVAEYGSGTSTLWWASRVASVTAVEHDPRWHALISSVAPPNVEMRFVPPERGVPSRPEFASAVMDGDFAHYVKALDDLPDRSLNVLCVDGRARSGCLLRALRKVRDDGLIVLDNCHRQRYQNAIQKIRDLGWRTRVFIGNGPYLASVQHTMIFERH